MVQFNAFWLSLVVSGSYVAAIYATSKESEEYPSGRDDPRVIRRRMKRVFMAMLLNVVQVPWVLCSQSNHLSFGEAFLNLGIIPGYYREGGWQITAYLWDVSRGVALILLLYIGPLLDSILYLLFVSRKTGLVECKNELCSIWGIRNYIFAPFTEELFYTSMVLNSYLSLKPSEELDYKVLVWQTPLFFGLAHLHHAHELSEQGILSWPTILMNTIFQTLYTTLFGSLTNYIFLKSGGNLWICICLHAICNFMGLPDSSKLVLHYTVVKKSQNAYVIRLLNLWKKCYLILLLMGLLFFKNQFPLLIQSTESLI